MRSAAKREAATPNGWKLKRTRQCEKCPWRVETDPRDIPNGYTEAKHRALKNTIADPEDVSFKLVHVMACHETQNAHCIGWLVHQLGPGHNIALRLRVHSCLNLNAIKLRGKQHRSFEDTLPRTGSDHHD